MGGLDGQNVKGTGSFCGDDLCDIKNLERTKFPGGGLSRGRPIRTVSGTVRKNSVEDGVRSMLRGDGQKGKRRKRDEDRALTGAKKCSVEENVGSRFGCETIPGRLG